MCDFPRMELGEVNYSRLIDLAENFDDSLGERDLADGERAIPVDEVIDKIEIGLDELQSHVRKLEMELERRKPRVDIERSPPLFNLERGELSGLKRDEERLPPLGISLVRGEQDSSRPAGVPGSEDAASLIARLKTEYEFSQGNEPIAMPRSLNRGSLQGMRSEDGHDVTPYASPPSLLRKRSLKPELPSLAVRKGSVTSESDFRHFTLQFSGLSNGLNSNDAVDTRLNGEPTDDYDLIFRSEFLPRKDSTSLIQIAAGDFFVHSDLLKRYRLGKVIGRGSSSVVKLATEAINSRGREVAIKMISKKGPHYNERAVAREVFIWRLLMETGGHENIVNMYEVGEDESRVYLTMECLTGGPLQDLLVTNRDLREDKVASIAQQMLESVKRCHDLRIVHRDIKPENYVFSSENWEESKLTLTDFGISFYSVDPNALCSTQVGTPLYVAPEVLYREPYGAEADIWSIGVIVHILLRGQPPFEQGTDGELQTLLKQIKYQTVKFDGPSWIFVSDNAKNFLTGLLQKDPQKRLTATEALKHPWILHTAKHRTPSNAAIANARLNIGAFFARKRWTTAILAVMCMNRILAEGYVRDLASIRIPDSQRLLTDYRRNRSLKSQHFVKREWEPPKERNFTPLQVAESDDASSDFRRESSSGGENVLRRLKTGMDGMAGSIRGGFLGGLGSKERKERVQGKPAGRKVPSPPQPKANVERQAQSDMPRSNTTMGNTTAKKASLQRQAESDMTRTTTLRGNILKQFRRFRSDERSVDGDTDKPGAERI